MAKAARPNVLMIAVDDLRPELACYGARHVHSPNIDALAESGMRFDRAYCSVAVCGASRASLLSGCRPETTGVWDAHTLLRSKMPDVLTLPGHFAASGYQTAFLGKVYHRPTDDAESWTVDADEWAPSDPDRGSRFLNVRRHRRQFRASTNPKVKPFPSTQNGGDVPDHAYRDGHNADRAVTLLERFAETEQPFFLAVGFHKPHLPFVAPGKYWDLYDRDAITPPSREKMRGSVSWARSTWGELKNYLDIGRDQEQLDDETTRRLIHGYYAATSYVDAQVGKLLAALERHDLDDRTIVVLWSDHGWYLGDYGEWCKHTNYEIATRVSLLLRVPAAAAPEATKGSCERLVELLDIYPTLCELTGLASPPHLHGHSLATLLADPETPWREAAISQYQKREPIVRTLPSGRTRRSGVTNLGTSVRTERFRYTRWKRIEAGETSAEELVDLIADPDSTANVIDDPQYADELPRLRALADRSGVGVAPPRLATSR